MMTLSRYNHVLSHGGVLPLAKRRFWVMKGPDRERYLNGQVTQEVRKAAKGGSHYACVCTAKGRMEGDLYFRDWPGHDAFLLDFCEELADTLPQRLEKYLIFDDVVLEDATEKISAVHVLGPLGDRLRRELEHEKVWFSVNDRLGIAGLDLFAEPETFAKIPFEAKDEITGEEAEQLRIFNGIPAWGAELELTSLPPEAGLEERAIDYHKGCYVGQEVISRLRSVGQVNKRLHRLVAEDGVPSAGEVVFSLSGEEPVEIGKITSVAMHPQLDRAIALAYLNRRQTVQGLRLTSASPESSTLCRFEPLNF